MRKPIILITGGNGEIGHGLISALNKNKQSNIVALDLQPIDSQINSLIQEGVVGNILDKNLLEQINSEYEVREIYHLAALLSTRAEFSPQMAHEVNVGGTINLLGLAVDQSKSLGKPVKFFFPSSIAVYGLDSISEKQLAGDIKESEYLKPKTMYGCNKLYCENLGYYYANHYQRLAQDFTPGLVDFRSIRFPGLISAMTIPTGGTSDFVPEMIHAIAQNKRYDSFVRENTQIPFMTMPEAIQATIQLMSTPKENLTTHTYNISSMNPTAKDVETLVKQYFSQADVQYSVNERRQSIVDSWPANVDDTKARTDWNWKPKFDLNSAFSEYLIPNIKEIYRKN
jgi:nucleoside-diphosphate-sugar epimerase